MTRLFLNGCYLVEGKDNDFWFEKGGLYFNFMLGATREDVVIVERLFLGILWSRKIYRVGKFPKGANVLARESALPQIA